MAKPVFYSIVKAIRSGEQESLQFTNLDPEDCSLVLESLADPRNALEERAFRYITSLTINNPCLLI